MRVNESWTIWLRDYINFDKIGIGLSLLCAVHCVVTPLVILSIPFMARYYLMHPYFHYLLAVFIIPVGVYAFAKGHRHHHNNKVFLFGFPGLFLVGVVPILVHKFAVPVNEPILMLAGSGLLVSAHWMNRKSCSCELHHH
jgi:hypothetical protein